MAYENQGNPLSLPASTGLRQYRAVRMHPTTGKVGYPTAAVGAPIVGVITDGGTTRTTNANQVASIQWGGIVKMEAEASTLHAGSWCCTSTNGRVLKWATGQYTIGQVVAGSSGAANRILSVMLLPVGKSTTLPAS